MRPTSSRPLKESEGALQILVGISPGVALSSRDSFRFLFVYELPRKSPCTIIPMEFDWHNHFRFAILAVPPIFVCSVQKDLVEQVQDSR